MTMPGPAVLAEEVRRVAEQREQEAALRVRREKSAQEVVAQIQKAREDIEQAVARMHELSLDLRVKARRTLDAGTSGYVLYANAHLRFAGALAQGLRRTSSMERMLVAAKREREEEERREEERQEARMVREHERHAQRHAHQLSLPTSDDFDELYGEVI